MEEILDKSFKKLNINSMNEFLLSKISNNYNKNLGYAILSLIFKTDSLYNIQSNNWNIVYKILSKT